MAKPPPSKLDKIISLCKRRGFVFPSGEIYGGTRSAWDYGPLGVELKENVKKQWWRSNVTQRDDVVGLDSAVILPTKTWEASGHLATFTDPLVECQSCHKRFREDHLQEEYAGKHDIADPDSVDINESVACPNCGNRHTWTEPRMFNMMLKTYLGVVEDESGLHYLRPETAQGIFLNFANIVTSARMKPPFGIAQMGKSFRNEITPGNFIFRTREFEQMEMEFFVKPGEDDEWHQFWIDERTRWFTDLGIDPANLRHFEHPQEKLSHYAKRTVDIEYRFGFSGREFEELEGIANRTDYDLTQHSKESGQDLSYFDQASGERYVPFTIEPALGPNRAMMAFLLDAYTEDEAPNTKGGVDTRTVLRLDPRLAPVKVAVLPLSRNADLSPKARDLAAELRGHGWNVDFDDSGAIGRRYRRQDEIGTPYCVTVDFDTLDDHAVTIRERDSMAQERISLDGISGYFAERLLGVERAQTELFARARRLTVHEEATAPHRNAREAAMKRLTTLAIAPLVALTAVGALTGSPAVAGTGAPAVSNTTHQVDVATLPVGPRARVAYLTGRLLHTASGKTITIDVPQRFQDSLELLGRSARGGWVVGYHHASAVLSVSSSGRVHRIAHYYEDFPGASQLYLSTNHRLVAIQGVDEGDAALFRVVDLDGRTVARHSWISGGSTVAFQGRTLWFSRWGSDDLHGSLVTWRMGDAPRHARGNAQAVEVLDLKHHQLLREVQTDPQYVGGVTPVSRPHTVRWTVCETCRPAYSATAFSPDGGELLGELGARDETIRSAEDGSVLSDLAFSLRVYGERWEGNHHVLVEVVDGPVRTGEHALVRCSLGGSCARVTKWQHHWLLSYAA